MGTDGICSALKGMVLGEGTETEDPVQAVKDVYAKGGAKDCDEFLKPIIVGGKERRLQGRCARSEEIAEGLANEKFRRRHRPVFQLPIR